jgi:single-strand selective monofunctional uracil DNA glycosylase
VEPVTIAHGLRRAIDRLKFPPPVAYVYNPLDYAGAIHDQYLRRYGTRPHEVLLLGMNPGPFGMMQTGVPFGDVVMVRDWLKLSGPVGHPAREHPKRPVRGFDCTRREVSGQRLWGWARRHYGTPEAFFATFFVYNYCPLGFLDEGGRNITPEQLPARVCGPLFEACDAALRRMAERLAPRHVLGIGRFACQRATVALEGMDLTIGTVLHPSPANPLANRGWDQFMDQAVAALDI